MKRTPRQDRCRPTAVPANGMRAIVDDYIREYRRHARAEMRFYAGQPTLADAVRVAAGCVRADGKRHPHQYRIPAASLQKAVRRLQRVDLAAAETFDELHDVINAAVRDIDMIGPLTVYDIAHRLGAFLGLEPTRVYLHRGTRDGARVLGLGRGRHALDLDELPREFHRLTAAEAEDCLCIYKAQLRELMETKPSFTIDKSKLPPLFPTHRHDPAFWCSLGRAVATFGYLEEMLKKAHLALTGTYPAPEDEDEAAAAVDEWHGSLERSIISTLNPLIDTVAKAAKDHPELRHQNLDEFVTKLRAAAKVRNLICHGSWGAPDANGASVAFYVSGRKRPEAVNATPVTVAWLDRLQAHTAELACGVIHLVTHMGYQFPGGAGPGRSVL